MAMDFLFISKFLFISNFLFFWIFYSTITMIYPFLCFSTFSLFMCYPMKFDFTGSSSGYKPLRVYMLYPIHFFNKLSPILVHCTANIDVELFHLVDIK